MEFQHILMIPKYPIICNIDGNLIAARSLKTFNKKLGKYKLDTDKRYDIIESTGHSWILHCNLKVISPFSIRKKWSKLELVKMYNSSIGTEKKYSEKSLSSKRYEKVFTDLVSLLQTK